MESSKLFIRTPSTFESNHKSVIDTIVFTDQNIQILLVDDSGSARITARAVLEKLGFIVDTAHNGQRAVEKVKSNKYDLILMDFEMPVMNGQRAASIIKNELNSTVPVIAISALSEEKIPSGWYDAFIEKPIEWRSAIHTIKQLLPAEKN